MPDLNARSNRTPRHIFFVFLLLALALVSVDQTSKFHAEKNFLNWSHPTEVHHMNTEKQHVFTVGISPSQAYKTGLPTSSITTNWLDFHLTYVRNTGAAWGALSTLPTSVRSPFFTAVTILALAVVGWLFATSHAGQRFYRIGLAFIFAGAIGNFADRIFLGYVIDWIQFHWKVLGWEYSFPVFNFADICINIGVGIILVDLLASELEMRRESIKNESNQ